MRIRRPRGLSGLQIGVATFLGVLGGIYIWKPLLQGENIKSTKE